jgi:hypothetical protein
VAPNSGPNDAQAVYLFISQLSHKLLLKIFSSKDAARQSASVSKAPPLLTLIINRSLSVPGHTAESFSLNDAQGATPRESTAIAGSLSAADHTGAFGAPRSAGAGSIASREADTFAGGGVSFDSQPNIYGASASGDNARALESTGAPPASGGSMRGDASGSGAGTAGYHAQPGGGAGSERYAAAGAGGHGSGQGTGAGSERLAAAGVGGQDSGQGTGAGAERSPAGGAGGPGLEPSAGFERSPAAAAGGPALEPGAGKGFDQAPAAAAGGPALEPGAGKGFDQTPAATAGDSLSFSQESTPAAERPENSMASPVMLANSDRVLEPFQKMTESPDWNEAGNREKFGAMYDAFNKEFPNEPRATIHQHYREWIPSYEKETERIKTEAPERRLDLVQQLTNKIMGDQGLPTVKVQGDSAVPMYGKGVISLPEETIMGPPEQLIASLTHEITHAEQDVLTISRIADKMGVGKTATADQQQAIAKEMGMAPDSQFLNDTLQYRNGKPLSQAETDRADALIQEHATKMPELHAYNKNWMARLDLPPLISQMQLQPGKASEYLRDLDKSSDPFTDYYKDQPGIQALLTTLPRDGNGVLLPGDAATDQKITSAFQKVEEDTAAETPQHMQNVQNFLWERESTPTGDAFRDLLLKKLEKQGSDQLGAE